jgi:hypothetical protein
MTIGGEGNRSVQPIRLPQDQVESCINYSTRDFQFEPHRSFRIKKRYSIGR